MATLMAILAVLGPIAGLGYAWWKKYYAPEVVLARLNAVEKAKQEATKVAAEELKAAYNKIDVEKLDEADIASRLNTPVK